MSSKIRIMTGVLLLKMPGPHRTVQNHTPVEAQDHDVLPIVKGNSIERPEAQPSLDSDDEDEVVHITPPPSLPAAPVFAPYMENPFKDGNFDIVDDFVKNISKMENGASIVSTITINNAPWNIELWTYKSTGRLKGSYQPKLLDLISEDRCLYTGRGARSWAIEKSTGNKLKYRTSQYYRGRQYTYGFMVISPSM